MLDTSDARIVSSGPAFEIWKSSRGAMRLDWTRKGAVRIIVEGHGLGDYAGPTIRRYEEAYRNVKRVVIFFDFYGMPSYDSPLRTETQGWGARHLNDMDAVYLLTKSKLVLMGASVANLALGGLMKVYSARPEFDRAVQQHGLPLNPPMSADG